MSDSAVTTLLSPEFVRRLDRLDVVSRRILAGKLQGERRSKRRGQSVEFADYRGYVPGDDLRFIDWNLYARLDRLFLRLFMEEEDLSVSILLDTSASMDWPTPEIAAQAAPDSDAESSAITKLDYARRVAAALGYIGLVRYNRVHVYRLSGGVADRLTNLRGRRPIPQLLDFIAAPAPGSAGGSPSIASSGGLAPALRQFAIEQPHKGVVILISDFLDKSDLAPALRYLAGDRYDVYCLQVLSEFERDPQKAGIVGDLRLLDVEDGQAVEVTITPELLRRYRETLDAYCDHLRQLCLKRDMVYLLTDTTVPFETLVLQYLRHRGLLG
ncbi:MAG: DUF58 domain-containing protein [Phycisphaeraceae bacterium]|nr:DUF58 domain-containing protein [Phycisphaeraceae bacterium]